MSTDLLFENARLQGRVITLEAEVKCLEAVVRAHQRLDCLQVKDLKAEVERLTNTSTNADRFLISGLEQDVAILKEQVERLRKLGTEMGKHLPDTDAANRAYIDFEAGGKS